MIVLGIDGALGAFSVAVADGEAILAARAEPGNVALERGLALIAVTLADAGVSAQRLDRLAIGCGPGSFTGLRIAIAYAKSLAQAWELPLVAVDSFDLLEYGRGLETALSIVVGRPGVISARLRRPGGMRRASGRIDAVLAEILADPPPGPLPVIGAPKDVLGALAERAIVVRSLEPMITSPAAAAALAAQSRPPAASVHEVRADYGELPAAKVPKLS
ncbi:MAG TPA: tRNA (adenosine(37)-N6)-threonylcarbamoyltransferase complex dimerization subunit type 1 TsaB [Candidatus Baltobacteraceae bacterium]|nr:tRNA (adenosine(37)-N6)-threonylcarbamoyltransferase complex dimerization subunit type 1 TsaB [Candidatus Baltobacteraceae bacterium]